MADTFAAAARAHLRYHSWACLELWKVLDGVTPEAIYADRKTSFGSIFHALAHIYMADSVWYSRLAGDGHVQLNTISAPPDIHSLRHEWTELLQKLTAWAEQLREEEWVKPVLYANSQGKTFSTLTWQVVLHLVNHGTAYRGQAIAMLRQAGITPPHTDLISFYRLESA